MKKLKTQEESKAEFIMALNNFNNELDKIDSETVYSHTEPEWWLDMMEIGRKSVTLCQKHK